LYLFQILKPFKLIVYFFGLVLSVYYFAKHVSNFFERIMFMCFHKMAKFVIVFIFPFEICFLCTFFLDISFESFGDYKFIVDS
jgi:hypothetical protein